MLGRLIPGNLSRGALFSLISALLQVAIIIVTVPLYLRIIGLERYGVVVVVWLLYDYGQVFNFGLDKAAVAFLSRHRDAMHLALPIFWTAAIMAFVLGFLGCLVASFGLTPMMGRWMGVSGKLIGEMGWGGVAVGLILWLTTFSSVSAGFLQSREQFFQWNLAQLLMSVVFQILPLTAAKLFGPSLQTVLIAGSIARMTMPITYIALSMRAGVTLKALTFSTEHARALTRYGAWTSLTNIISPLLFNFDRLLISSQLGSAAVALYAVPYNLVMRIQVLPTSLASVLFPRLSLQNDEDRQALAEEGVKSLGIVLAPILIVGAFALQPFLKIWLGPAFPPQLARVGEILLVGIWFNALAVVPYITLQALGRPDSIAKLHAYEIIPFIIFLWFAVQYAGVEGAAVAWSLRAIADSLVLFRMARLLKVLMVDLLVPLIVLTLAVGLVVAVTLPLWIAVVMAAIAGALISVWSWGVAPENLRAIIRRIVSVVTRRAYAIENSQ